MRGKNRTGKKRGGGRIEGVRKERQELNGKKRR
jgi:hypothetical protein